MRNDPRYPSTLPVSVDHGSSEEGVRDATARIGERRSYAAPYESLTFTLLTRARRELIITLAAQPVFDLVRSTPVARRIRRSVRHRGGESALIGLGRRTLVAADLVRFDIQTLRTGLDLLRMGREDI